LNTLGKRQSSQTLQLNLDIGFQTTAGIQEI
jgi:hypothetical protein